MLGTRHMASIGASNGRANRSMIDLPPAARTPCGWETRPTVVERGGVGCWLMSLTSGEPGPPDLRRAARRNSPALC
jgi:hypothetical protein